MALLAIDMNASKWTYPWMYHLLGNSLRSFKASWRWEAAPRPRWSRWALSDVIFQRKTLTVMLFSLSVFS